MPHYKIAIEGGPCLVAVEGTVKSVGFFTTRYVTATNELEAKVAAIKEVTLELSVMLVATSPQPNLLVTEIAHTSFLKKLLKAEGFTFYLSEEVDDVLQ